jgi:hypothetical protein
MTEVAIPSSAPAAAASGPSRKSFSRKIPLVAVIVAVLAVAAVGVQTTAMCLCDGRDHRYQKECTAQEHQDGPRFADGLSSPNYTRAKRDIDHASPSLMLHIGNQPPIAGLPSGNTMFPQSRGFD